MYVDHFYGIKLYLLGTNWALHVYFDIYISREEAGSISLRRYPGNISVRRK
jgi:hypothetical protein